MALEIDPKLAATFPMAVKSALSKMSTEEQVMFLEQYEKQAKSTGIMLALAILFPIQLFLLGETGLGIIFWLTAGGFFVWYIIEIFLTPKRVKRYNEKIATKILTDMKMMNIGTEK